MISSEFEATFTLSVFAHKVFGRRISNFGVGVGALNFLNGTIQSRHVVIPVGK